MFDDSMFKLEHGSKDKNTAESLKPGLARLFNRNEDVWSDDYTANQKLRAQFRVCYDFTTIFILYKQNHNFSLVRNRLLYANTKSVIF